MEENTLLLPKTVLDQLPTMVKNELSKLGPQKQQEFLEEYQRKSKSTGLAYLLWFFGFHYAYFGRWALCILFLLSCILVVGVIWWVIDAFRIPSIRRNYNQDRAIDVLRNLKAISG